MSNPQHWMPGTYDGVLTMAADWMGIIPSKVTAKTGPKPAANRPERVFDAVVTYTERRKLMFNFFRLNYIEFRNAANETYAFLEENHGRLGIPSPKSAIFAPLTAFNAVCAAPRYAGKTATMLKKETREALKKTFRAYGEEHLFLNPALTPADKSRARLHIAKETRTAPSAPDTIPLVIVITSVIRQLSFMYWGVDRKRAGKPRNVGFFVLRWALLDHYPAGLEELVNVTESTKPPLTLLFREADRGKKLYFVVSWRIARGVLEGPASDILMAIVP